MKFYLFGLLIVASIFSLAQAKIPTAIDGDLKDWDLPLKYLNSDTKLNYCIVNSDSAFFVSIRVVEEPVIMRIMQSGFQISINTKGKKRQGFDVQFKPENTLTFEPGIKKDVKNIKDNFIQTPLLVNLHGFTKTKNDIYLASKLQSIQLAMKWDSLNILNIECKIPFAELDYQISEKEIALGIILFAINLPQSMQAPPSGMDGPPPGMSPPPGGSGGPPQNGVELNDLITEKRIWLKVKPKF